MIRVILESPYAGDVARNLDYVREAMRHSLGEGEAPFASHALYTQHGCLDDGVPYERRLGIDAGLHWGEVADRTVVYCDLGVSPGMLYGIAHARTCKRTVVFRWIRGPGPIVEKPDVLWQSRYPLFGDPDSLTTIPSRL